jgi:ubiquinol-cytochrome c reductase iron-sulfur subunit
MRAQEFIVESTTVERDGITLDYEFSSNQQKLNIIALSNGRRLGSAKFQNYGPLDRPEYKGDQVEVDERYRGQGIATVMYDLARELVGRIYPSPAQTQNGQAFWRGKPVWVVRRNQDQVKELAKLEGELADPKSLRDPAALTPAYARNEYRSIKPEYLVVVGICSHLGCSPTAKIQAGPQPSVPNDWPGGFLCPCHGSTFDLAGRVYKNKPAPDNLEVPPHMYLSDTKILIGEDKKA